ncbi:MAG: gluconokinase, GntK/IdnK-type [Pseudomonadota bacterium]
MNAPSLVICMGVSGCGKSTLAAALANELGWTLVEADDFHNDENRERMRSGQPLRDSDREPWMAAIVERLGELARRHQSCVMAHSALRRAHREALRDVGLSTQFLFLDCASEVLVDRLQKRRDHFMPAELLPSQYRALEPPTDEPDIVRLNAADSLQTLLSVSLATLNHNRKVSHA